MNKDELQKLCTLRGSVCTAPPREWLAIPEDGSQTVKFNLNDVENCDDGQYIEASDEDGNYVVYLHLCHLCAFTGYCDSKGEKVYQGHVIQESYVTKLWSKWLVYWDKGKAGWYCRDLETAETACCGDLFGSAENTGRAITIISHIHIPSEWSKILSDSEVPEEVREVLYKVKKVSDE